MLKLNNMLENVYKQGCCGGCPPLEEVASNEVEPAQAQPSPRLAKSLLKKSNACYTIVVFS